MAAPGSPVPPPAPAARAAALAVHVFTASGALLGFLALRAALGGNLRDAFLWLMAATAVDAIDGVLARAARVRDAAPHIDGARLDDVVDYVTYVFVPAVVAWHAGLLPAGAALPVAAAMLVSSALGFSRSDAKTEDYFFTGFPSYWNIVVFYLAAGALPPAVNAGILLACAALVFVPIRYVYPSRTPALRGLTNGLGVAWAGGMVLLALQLPAVHQGWLLASLSYPAYYTALSLTLHARRRRVDRPRPARGV